MKGEAKVGDYTLAFDFNALCLAEDECGPLGDAMQNMGAGSLKTIRALFWAGLQKNHACSIGQAGEIVQELGIENAGEAIAKGVEAPFAKAPKGGNPKAVQS